MSRLPRKLKKKLKKEIKPEEIKDALFTVWKRMVLAAVKAQMFKISLDNLRHPFPPGGTVHKGEEYIIRK